MSTEFLNASDIPLNNNTALNDDIVHRWVSGATTRGTADILYTCVVTIVLCVWTSVHMNIPGPGEHPSRRLWRKIKWTLYGLLAPELVLFTAWAQYNEAKNLVKYLNEQRMRHQTEKTMRNQINESFNLRYGFFAVMGGFRVPHPGLEDKSRLISLTQGALRALAFTGRFLWVDDREVQDRSKADGLAKLLICAQVTWLSVECIARKASNLPLTILEIHTFIHVVCALTIYLVWFKKPLDITEATVANPAIEDEELLSLLYLLGLLRDERTFQVLCTTSTHQTSQFQDTSSRQWFKFTTHPNGFHVTRKPKDELARESTSIFAKIVDDDTFKKNAATRLKVDSYAITGNDEVGMEINVAVRPYIEHNGTTTTNFLSYKLAWPDSVLPSTRKQAFRAWTRLNRIDMDLAAWRFGMSSRAENFVDLHTSWYSIAMNLVILMTYGGVHLTAWSSHFPTKIEMWLWRSSALLLAGTTPLMVSSWFISAIVYFYFDMNRTSSLGKFFWFYCWVLGVLLMTVMFAAYLFARCFLVVESFISLRSVPIGVYSAVTWSNLVPHI